MKPFNINVRETASLPTWTHLGPLWFPWRKNYVLLTFSMLIKNLPNGKFDSRKEKKKFLILPSQNLGMTLVMVPNTKKNNNMIDV